MELVLQSGIYFIQNQVNGKMYVGSAKQFKHRWEVHLSILRKGQHHCSHLQHAWNKYGEDSFEFLVVDLCPVEDLISREQEWIDFTGCTDESKGYNVAPVAGSTLGYKYTDEQKKNLSKGVSRHYDEQAHRERQRVKMKELWDTPAFREKMSEIAKERWDTPEGKAQLRAARSARTDYSMMSRVRAARKSRANQFDEWLSEHDAYLHDHYVQDGCRDCAQHLNRSETSVRMRASFLGLKRKNTQAFKDTMHAAAMNRPLGPNQRTCLDLLKEHRCWHVGCKWKLPKGNVATRRILETLVARDYVRKEGHYYYPTDLSQS